jgi:hypothetical protein
MIAVSTSIWYGLEVEKAIWIDNAKFSMASSSECLLHTLASCDFENMHLSAVAVCQMPYSNLGVYRERTFYGPVHISLSVAFFRGRGGGGLFSHRSRNGQKLFFEICVALPLHEVLTI